MDKRTPTLLLARDTNPGHQEFCLNMQTQPVAGMGRHMAKAQAARGKAPIEVRREQQPKTADMNAVSLDILDGLLSYYMRVVSVMLNRDYDHTLSGVSLAHGTGKVSTLLMVAANPGIRPSVLAHYVLRDRSAMTRLLQQMKTAGLIVEQFSVKERRARELYLTAKGRSIVDKVRSLATSQSETFFGVLAASEQKQLMELLKKLYSAHVHLGEDG